LRRRAGSERTYYQNLVVRGETAAVRAVVLASSKQANSPVQKYFDPITPAGSRVERVNYTLPGPKFLDKSKKVLGIQMMVAKVSANQVQQRAQPAARDPLLQNGIGGLEAAHLQQMRGFQTSDPILEQYPRSWSCGSRSFVIRSRRKLSKRFKVQVALFREIRSKHSRPSSKSHRPGRREPRFRTEKLRILE